MEFIGIVLILAIIYMLASVRMVMEYERGVVYTLGQCTGFKGPGLCFAWLFLQQMVRVDMRIRTEDIPSQDVISRDNVSVKVNAVVYYRIVDPAFSINKVENFIVATSQLAQTTLREILGQHDLDDMLSHRDKLNKDIHEILDTKTDGWGIKVTDVAIKHIDLDPTMIRAMAKQAEAERERRAKIINAEGELQAAKQLDEAAAILARRPETMQLRYLGTLGEFVNAKGNTVVLPMPLDLLRGVADAVKKAA